MPRLSAGDQGHTYLANLNFENNITTTTTPSAASHSRSGDSAQSQNGYPPIAPAPSSGDMPRPPSSFKAQSSSMLHSRIGLSPGGKLGSVASFSSPARDRADSDQYGLSHVPLTDSAPTKPRRTVLRAIEPGKGTLLPDINRVSSTGTAHGASFVNGRKAPAKREPPNRVQTRSTPSLKAVMSLPGIPSYRNTDSDTNCSPVSNKSVRSRRGGGNINPILPTHHAHSEKPKLSILQSAKNALRRRTPSGYSDDEDGNVLPRYNPSGSEGRRRNHSHGSNHSRESPYRTRSRSKQYKGSIFDQLWRLKLGNFFQLIIVLSILILVWESHHKAKFAAEQLIQFKDEENLLLLHLQQIERQSIAVHENLSRLATSRANEGNSNSNSLVQEEHSHQDPAIEVAKAVNGADAAAAASGSVDIELIQKQIQQLYQMEEELNHELRSLETRIQTSARNHIIQEFGEGPVQVVLDLDFGDDPNVQQQGAVHGGSKKSKASANRIAILLWHDTPHAAWTWLEQIGRHVWDGADFTWQQAHVIDAAPRKHDPLGNKIEFIEQAQHGHEAWTVGLRNNDPSTNGSNGLGMFINLQDNTHHHRHETCVGKVIDGFDALQRLLEVSRNRSYDQKTSIKIKSASAMHVTKREAATR